jgi:long-chain-alcohol oxidase
MAHSPQHLASAALLADTFVPAADGLPSASELGAAEIMLDMAARNPRAADRRQLETLLNLWDTRAFAVLTRGRPTRFSELTQAEREAFVLSLGQSRVPQKRGLFSALRFGLMVASYAAPGPTGTSPLWEQRVGYAPPFGVRPDALLRGRWRHCGSSRTPS